MGDGVVGRFTKRTAIFAAAVACFTLLWMTAEAPVARAAGARVVTHELGETEITGTPERVVVLEFSFIDALASLGVTPVGVADDGDPSRIIPPIRSVIGTPTSVGTRKQPSLEVIRTLKPDLIIADLQRHKGIYADLSKIAPTIVLKSLGSSYEENVEAVLAIGEALNRTEDVNARLREHDDTMALLVSSVPEGDARTFLPAVVTENGMTAHTSVAYESEVLEMIGLNHVMTGSTGGRGYLGAEAYVQINLEQLIGLNPDILFVMTVGGRTIVDEWASNPLWQNLKAVRNGQVYEVDRNLWSRFRGILSAELIAQQAVDLLYEK